MAERNFRRSVVTISVGAVCGAIRAEGDFELLLEKADRALYAAKADGRNTWRVSIEAEAEAKRVVA